MLADQGDDHVLLQLARDLLGAIAEEERAGVSRTLAWTANALLAVSQSYQTIARAPA